MFLIQITPGAGGMYCGNCFRDHALVSAWGRLGHEATLIPLYLPMRLDEEGGHGVGRIFYSGINVYLDQHVPGYSKVPNWMRRWMSSPGLLKWAAGRAAKTRAEDVGDITLSMLRGEEGRQARELEELIDWLRSQARPDAICLSNGLLVGLARQLREALGVPVVGMLQGEDTFLDALPSRDRAAAWKLLAERSADVAVFMTPSCYYARLMEQRLGLAPGRIEVVPNGIDVEGFGPEPERGIPPTIGYFARMCPEKGMDLLVEAFIEIRRRGRVGSARLKLGGGCGPGDEPFVQEMKAKLARAGLLSEVTFSPNLNRTAKRDFLKSLTVFSVPAPYGEAFGLYLLEAWATGLPVVQPRHAAFPEIVESTAGGLLCEAGSVGSLADGIETLLLDPVRARQFGEAGRKAVLSSYTAEAMARRTVAVLEKAKMVFDGGSATRAVPCS